MNTKNYNWDVYEEERAINAKLVGYFEDKAILTYVWKDESISIHYPLYLLPKNININDIVTIVVFNSESLEQERNKILKRLMKEILN